MAVLHIERLLYYLRCSLYMYGLKLHERYDWRATATDIHWSFSDTTVSVYTASRYVQCYNSYATMHDNNIHVPYH